MTTKPKILETHTTPKIEAESGFQISQAKYGGFNIFKNRMDMDIVREMASFSTAAEASEWLKLQLTKMEKDRKGKDNSS